MSIKITIVILTIISTFTTKTTNIIKNNVKNINSSYNYIKIDKKEDIIGKIKINKLKIDSNLYDIDSPNNNVDKNITILKESSYPNTENGTLIIAAHSGNGSKAYFKDLDKLTYNDEINITYKNKSYTYTVKNIWEQNKNGYINLYKEKTNQLILTTCSPNKENKQLIINCILKES